MNDNAEDEARELVGCTLGNGYRLEELIGRGAMGAVYRATAPTGSEVAVKTLHPQMMGDHSQRFLREGELVRGLRHPHVVRTLDSGADQTSGLLYLVMPLLKGRDLDPVLDQLGALEPQTAVRIALQAARGLTAAHRVGIIHRDVKPGNLVLDEEDDELVVRVCDFGIAKRLGGDSLTATGSQLGTPDYVSPEQLKSSKHVDERADVWSLGATLYQMLCGAAPFAHIEAVFDLITAIVSEDVPHLQDRAPWLDGKLCLVVHKALQRDPNSRWATMEDMADALRPFSGGDELLSPASISAVSAQTRQLVAPRVDLRDAPKHGSGDAPARSELDELGLVTQKLGGRYLVKRLIGKGGMGNVYEVEGENGERLAAKVVAAGVTGASPSTLQRFAREAKASSAINSVHVARTVDAGCDGALGFPYIIMELLRGADLAHVMKREGALPPEIAVRVVLQAARGVAAAHARGVVHRDIKPANLFLQQDPKSSQITVKVCDFGVAKRVAVLGIGSASSQESLTHSGGMVGSPLYMSPEQAKNAKAVDARTDVWSLSAVLWEALTGERLWSGQRSLGELIAAICAQPIRSAQAVAPWVPPELSRVVEQGLARDPNDRIATMQSLVERLEPFTGGSDRLVMAQLSGLTDQQRRDLTLKARSPDSDAGRAHEQARKPKFLPGAAAGATATTAGRAPRRNRPDGIGKGAVLVVAVASAAIAGTAAYFFARSQTRAASTEALATSSPMPATSTASRSSASAPPAPAVVRATVQVSPADASVTTPTGPLLVVDGVTTLTGVAGETVTVTVERGSARKTFSVSLGSDGIATPGRLVLAP